MRRMRRLEGIGLLRNLCQRKQAAIRENYSDCSLCGVAGEPTLRLAAAFRETLSQEDDRTMNEPYGDHMKAARPAGTEMVARLAAVIRDARLDCACRLELDEALKRFALMESRRAARRHLADARACRKRIETILFFLRDVDELGPAEPDSTVYTDIVLLFEEIERTARAGADATRRLSGSPTPA
jgi:hypothetical protein